MDNPKKPYKAYGAAAATLLTALVAEGVLDMPWSGVATAVAAAITVFFIPNPQK